MSKIVAVKDFPNYFVTDDGDVYSKDYMHTSKTKRLKPIRKTTGYYSVWLSNGTKRANKLIHRIVAESFIPNPLSKKTVNHINGNKGDNRAQNLEWSTYSENEKHAYNTRIRQPPMSTLGKFGKDNPKSRPVLQIKDGVVIAEFAGLSEAERATGVHAGNICRCCKGKRLYANGFRWQYKN